jgi:hypothetical protein
MAYKKYAYYLKGNKLALIQQEISGGNLEFTDDAGNVITRGSSDPAVRGLYKSPQQTVADGIEIEYSYAPVYNLQSTYTNDSDLFKFIGWGSDGTNLLLFTYSAAAVKDLASKFAADDWIYINAGRWTGLHQVKSTGGATGILTLKTKCRITPNKLAVQGTFSTATDTFAGENAAQQNLMQEFMDDSAGLSTKYIFIDAATSVLDNGFFEITHNATHGVINLINKITINATNDYTSTAANTSDEGSDDIVIYNAFYEQMEVYKNVEVMEDETFELDLTRYQANALVLFIRARLFEEQGDLEKFEYYMARFRKQVEKSSGSRKHGSFMIQGFGMTR